VVKHDYVLSREELVDPEPGPTELTDHLFTASLSD